MLLDTGWYNRNATRNYPLDDTASGVGVTYVTGPSGQPETLPLQLPTDVLVDCQIKFPGPTGSTAYLGSVTVTNRIVSVTVMAEYAGTSTTPFAPIAAVTVPQPVREGFHYPITALQQGVGGFVVFGAGVRTPVVAPIGGRSDANGWSIRFFDAAAARLAARCCQAYPPLPISSISKYGPLRIPRESAKTPNADKLTGVVTLAAGTDVEIVYDTVEVVGYGYQQAVVFRLKKTEGRDVFEEYIGCCDGRPESYNCGTEGIESINDVVPDCMGNINLVFSGVQAAFYYDPEEEEPAGGIVLDIGLALEDVCVERDPSRRDGSDYCDTSSEVDEEPVVRLPPEYPAATLPIFEDFRSGHHGSHEIPDWTTVSGDFVSIFYDPANAVWRSNNLAAVCVGLYDYPIESRGVDDYGLILRLKDGPNRCAGLAFGYRRLVINNKIYADYYRVLIDQLRNRVVVEHVAGCVVELLAVSPQKPFLRDVNYRIQVSVSAGEPDGGNDASIRLIEVLGPDDYDWPPVVIDREIALTAYPYRTKGQAGVVSVNSAAEFIRFEVV